MELKENERRVFVGKLYAEYKYWNEKGKVDTAIPFSNMNLSLEKILSLWKKEYWGDWDNTKNDNATKQESTSSESEPGFEGNAGKHQNTQNTQNYIAKFFSPREVRIDRKNGIVIVLFDATDLNGADVTYKNYKTMRSRRNRKEKYEGINYSAHLILKIDGNNGIYDAAFEDVPFLTVNMINNVLSKMASCIRNHNKELFAIQSPLGIPDKRGNIKKEPCRLHLSFQPIPDQRFWDIVSHRDAIASLELVKTKPQNDDDFPLDIKKQSVVFSLPPQSFCDKAKDGFLKIITFGRRNHFDEFKVAIKTDAGKIKTVWFDTNKKIDDYKSFSKMELIEDLSEKMATASEEINEELVEKMKDLLS